MDPQYLRGKEVAENDFMVLLPEIRALLVLAFETIHDIPSLKSLSYSDNKGNFSITKSLLATSNALSLLRSRYSRFG